MREHLTPEEKYWMGPQSLIDYEALPDDEKAKLTKRFRAGEAGKESVMRTAGKVGFCLSFLLAIGAAIPATQGETAGFVLLALATSVTGLFALMWMLGAIEHRLILIYEVLRRRG